MPGFVPQRVLLYRITHYLNIPDIIKKGMFSANNPARSINANAVGIGNVSLIDKRGSKQVEVGPKGSLNDYVPFYLGRHSPMLLNIITGYNVPKKPQREIVYVCSELSRINTLQLPFVFSDGHAYARFARFFDDPTDLAELDWDVIRAKDWHRTEEDNDRQRRKQAEFLIYQYVPVDAIISIVVFDEQMAQWIRPHLVEIGANFTVHVLPDWYYTH